jgi:hypothetical protein
MLYLLKPLASKVAKLKDVKEGGEGVCQFCGRETVLADKSVLPRWLKGSSNPGITRAPLGYPDVCVECLQVLISALKPSQFANAYNKASLFVSGYRENGEEIAEGLLFDSEKEFKQFLDNLGRGLYVFLFFLSRGNFLPIIDLPNLSATSNPAVSVTLNVVEGSSMRVEVIPTPLLFEKESNGLVKVLKKRVLGGKK